MTFFLNVIVCSVILNTCTNPIPIGSFNTYQECGLAGYEYALNHFKGYPIEDVNKFQTLIKFYCLPTEVTES